MTTPTSSSAASSSTIPTARHSFGRIDLYKRGCFVLETKQGIEKQDEEQLLSAAGQERTRTPQERPRHARLHRLERHTPPRPRPGRAIRPLPHRATKAARRSWSSSTSATRSSSTPSSRKPAAPTSRSPTPAPTASSLDELADPDIRDRLRAVWLDPLSLDPARRSAKVTREIAASLAKLASSLEAAKHDPAGRRPVPHALPVHDVRRGRRPAAQEKVLQRLAQIASTTRPTSSRSSKTSGGK